MRYLLFHTPDWQPGQIAFVLASEQIDGHPIVSIDDLPKVSRPAVVVLGPKAMAEWSPADLALVWQRGAAPLP